MVTAVNTSKLPFEKPLGILSFTNFFMGGPRSIWYGRTAAFRLIVQLCDKDDEVLFCFSIFNGAPIV
jgi:hypothetical protein